MDSGTRGLPESPVKVIRIGSETDSGTARVYQVLAHVYQVLKIQAELLLYSEEYQQLNPNLGDWGMCYAR